MITPENKLKLKLPPSESGAYMYEISPNSVLLRVNEQPLSSIDDLRKFDRNNIQNLEYLSPNGEKERISFRRR